MCENNKKQEDLMEPSNNTTKWKKYKHINEVERYKIEAYLEAKKSAKEIAQLLGRDRSTIYREIKRGKVILLDSELRKKERYKADVGQRMYEEAGRNKERSLKIGQDRRLEQYIRKKILNDKYSPDAVIGEIKRKGLKFKGMICTKTLYNYIDAGIFADISNENLWQKRNKPKRGYHPVRKVSLRNKTARRITERPLEANERLEYGHWEGDCVKGKRGSKTSLLTLTERKTLEEIIIKLKQTTQAEVQKAIDALEEKRSESFNLKFKTITFDNGSEFLDWEALELSVFDKKTRRITIYFAHAYSAWERGSNENANRMIRRFVPKGEDISRFSNREIKDIENWMNNYPRKKLGYKSAKQAAQECLRNNRDLGLDFVAV